MNSNVKQIALKICLIKEEYPEKDIFEAMKLLQKEGINFEILNLLDVSKTSDSISKANKPGKKSKSINKQRSKAVIELENKEPEKYQLLSRLDSLIRERRILPKLDDIKDFGEQISKDFAPKSSRRDAISKLMTLIANLSTDEIKELMSNIPPSSVTENHDDDYQELARFIIKGTSSRI